ncbi:MAG: hypothetical protein OZSIB_0605 [Candidatus Ozemobacter sibiricus]|jgi:ribosomal 50S subunit-recycling heat shock protein|uniref:RNA-binding S4 domain-containing protein n=1 Tax=Candidatus Ozemobacter sibiricus TaxID=2268124 RepID=A0A367ZVW5_9BACT|nr:MAG: hypothetical protein OZSIB_0605 [Candidatus Ozemobacter sibiricus]
MRLDKFLQVSGLIKRRVLANEACRRGLVKVNGQLAKPTRELQPGDEVALDLPRRDVAVRIRQALPDRPFSKVQRADYVEVLRDLPRAGPPDDPDGESW